LPGRKIPATIGTTRGVTTLHTRSSRPRPRRRRQLLAPWDNVGRLDAGVDRGMAPPEA